jgi:hypothetical protein
VVILVAPKKGWAKRSGLNLNQKKSKPCKHESIQASQLCSLWKPNDPSAVESYASGGKCAGDP